MEILRNVFMFFFSLGLAFWPVSTYKEGVAGQPSSFLPSKATTQHELTVAHLIYRSLFKYDIYGSLLPDLADTWAISEDGIVYTIKLKDNQFWSNGKKITSDDLIYTSYKVSALSGVATDKVDELTVRYTLPNKYSPFLSLLTVGVMHVDSEEKERHLRPVTSGDWQIVGTDTNGQILKKVILRTRTDKYEIKKLIFQYYPNEEEVVTAAKLGEIDAFILQEDTELKNFANYKFPTQGIYYALYFNLANEKFKELTLRQKMAKVLPIKDLIFDKGITVEGPISRSIFTDRNITFDTTDPVFTEDLLDLQVTITVADIPSQVDFAERVEKYWEDKLSLDVTINTVNPKEIVEQVIQPRNYEILLYGQEVGQDPDRYVNWHSTQKVSPGLNLSSFEQVRADRALEEGRKELDNDVRKVHYNEFQKVLTENTPAIFLYHPFTNYYVSKFIEGIGEKLTFTQADRFIDLENWRRVATN